MYKSYNRIMLNSSNQSKILISRLLPQYKLYHDIITGKKNHTQLYKYLINTNYQNTDEAESTLKKTNQWIQTTTGRNAILNFTTDFKNSLNINTSKDMISFIEGRSKSGASDMNHEDDYLMYLRSLSSLLTFPLTLSYSLNALFSSLNMIYKEGNVNVLVLGARSESSLPLIWWQECMLTSKFTNIDIRMLGPGLQINKNKQTNNKANNNTITHMIKNELNQDIAKRLSIINNQVDGKVSSIDMITLHHHSQSLELMQWADVFILFNPGYGNDNLKSSWDPTMRLLLHTHKPIICTAYGNHDLRRDLSVLDQITSEEDYQDLGEPIDFLIPPHENPFQSFKHSMDPKEIGDQGIITTNHSLYAIRAK